MTPREKAEELVNKINDKIISFENIKLRGEGYEISKQCALIAVDEILNGAMIWQLIEGKTRIFWQQVKEEIEKQ